MKRFALPLCTLLALCCAACTTTIPPAYLDYKAKPDEKNVRNRIETVLKAQNWNTLLQNAPSLQTEEKEISDLVAYKLLVSLEVLEMQDHRIRIWIHTTRKYRLSGTRSKLPYLERHVKKSVAMPLQKAMKEAGFE